MAKYDGVPSGLKQFTYDGYSQLLRFDTRLPEIIMVEGFSGTNSNKTHYYRPFQEKTVFASESMEGIYYFRDTIKITIQGQQKLFPDAFIQSVEKNIAFHNCYGFLYRLNVWGMPTIPLQGAHFQAENEDSYLSQSDSCKELYRAFVAGMGLCQQVFGAKGRCA